MEQAGQAASKPLLRWHEQLAPEIALDWVTNERMKASSYLIIIAYPSVVS